MTHNCKVVAHLNSIFCQRSRTHCSIYSADKVDVLLQRRMFICFGATLDIYFHLCRELSFIANHLVFCSSNLPSDSVYGKQTKCWRSFAEISYPRHYCHEFGQIILHSYAQVTSLYTDHEMSNTWQDAATELEPVLPPVDFLTTRPRSCYNAINSSKGFCRNAKKYVQ